MKVIGWMKIRKKRQYVSTKDPTTQKNGKVTMSQHALQWQNSKIKQT